MFKNFLNRGENPKGACKIISITGGFGFENKNYGEESAVGKV